jgi:hypothetical protein
MLPTDWAAGFEKIKQAASKKRIPVFLVTADADKAVTFFHVVPPL